jgi:hypothetical protein
MRKLIFTAIAGVMLAAPRRSLAGRVGETTHRRDEGPWLPLVL